MFEVETIFICDECKYKKNKPIYYCRLCSTITSTATLNMIKQCGFLLCENCIKKHQDTHIAYFREKLKDVESGDNIIPLLFDAL